MKKMDARTLKALRGSIKKWEKIWKGTGEDRAGDNCPLCQAMEAAFEGCEECPVYKKTGKHQCMETPYQDWFVHHVCTHNLKDKIVYCPTCKRLAKRELDFLKSLLPNTARKVKEAK